MQAPTTEEDADGMIARLRIGAYREQVAQLYWLQARRQECADWFWRAAPSELRGYWLRKLEALDELEAMIMQ